MINMTKTIFDTKEFHFPYTGIRFPGMNEGEKIMFITREAYIVHLTRLLIFTVIILLIGILGVVLLNLLGSVVSKIAFLKLVLLVLVGLFFTAGGWWLNESYRKSIFIITTRRLTKIIHTTPFTWYQFSLGLDEIEDTGSYGASYIEALLGLGYFVARSGAGAIKNFKIVNITFAQDLHNYVNKLLYAFKHHPDKMDLFRPFTPNLRGEAREELFRKYPEYKTEF